MLKWGIAISASSVRLPEECNATSVERAKRRLPKQKGRSFTAAITRDPVRWQARVVATIEFLSYVRRHPELHGRLLEAQRLADAAMGELVVAICRALGIEPPAAVEE